MIIEGANGSVLENAGAPGAGTDQVWTLTIDASGGSFKFSFEGFTTGAIAWSSTNNTLRDNVDAALELLPSIGTGGVTTAVGTMTSGVGTLTITASGNLTKRAQAELGTMAVANNSLSGTATCSVAVTTPGVNATGRGAGAGRLCLDTTNKKLYINTGTALAPTWTVVGAQS